MVPLLDTLTSQVGPDGDFSPFNVLVDPDKPDYVTGIIDFGDVVRTSVIFDISVTMANLLGATSAAPGSTHFTSWMAIGASVRYPARSLKP